MSKINNAFCPNKDCKDYGLRNRDNITFRGKYGKNKKRDLLYCRTCGKRFASTRATAFFGLHLSDDKIEQIIHHVAEGVSEQELGKKWIWTTIDTPTRLIVCFLIGDRTLEDARKF